MALYTPLTADELGEVAACYGLPPPERHAPEPKGSVNTNYHLWAGGRRLFGLQRACHGDQHGKHPDHSHQVPSSTG